MIPKFIKQIDWGLLQQQKQFMLELNMPEAYGIVNFLDAFQDYCVEG